jgi:phosphate transport system permease protein
MAVDIETLDTGGPASPVRPRPVSVARSRRRIRADRWASRLVVVGGIAVIASILGILLVIVGETWPLFRAPTMSPPVPLDAGRTGQSWATVSPEAFEVDEYRELALTVDPQGFVHLGALKAPRELPDAAVPALGDARLSAAAAGGPGRYVLGTTDGRAVLLEVTFDVAYDDGRRTVTPRLRFGAASQVDPGGRPIRRLAAAWPDTGPVTVGQVGPAELALERVTERKALVGPGRRERAVQTLPLAIDGEITALRLDGRGEDLVVGTSRGRLLRYELSDAGGPALAETVDATAGGAPVTVLGFLIGDRTLVVGDGAGGVSSWQLVRPAVGPRRLARIHRFEPHAAAVIGFAASRRDKGFVTGDSRGGLHLSHGTSGRTLLRTAPGDDGLRAVALAPKGDAVLVLDDRGRITSRELHNPHPEVTLGTLFGRVWYEGYDEPAYVWQSTGGTDDFESKLSLTPLLYGTLKGTFYALLIAVPLSLLAAVYVSEFMHPTVKGYVKPVVEIMAALPSVVLGFLAGLWLAPVIERIVPGIFIAPVVVVVSSLVALLCWQRVPPSLRSRLRGGAELLLLVPAVAIGLWAAFGLGGLLEDALLGGNYRAWLHSALGVTYDQRNSLVVGIAMGFAVIPIIFTIAEDSLANVPAHLRAGSLALGATRWQTAVRIVLPTASPGIFSAVMIGFGRAVGETMIVLMATGNTPVMDWSIFNGFRALSANIAVELPEAPEGGTLFRVLFLAAFLLFCLTFAVNTAAELVRLRLRQKYRAL